jgi:glutamate dehydrogenase
VLEEQPTPLDGGELGYIHDFVLEMPGEGDAAEVLARAKLIERAIAAVLEGRAENDPFNQLLVGAGLKPRDIVLFRAWFRYLRQTGLSYSLITVVEALRRAPGVARGLIALFDAQHDPAAQGGREDAVRKAEAAINDGLAQVAAIDEDRILRLVRGVIQATLRTNAFAQSGKEALAFKLDSSLVPNLPAPVPWREIWVYSPRVEGIHLRSGPVARGGLRWSDRRDDFRTEILGLMKAQVVKNAVIVPDRRQGRLLPQAAAADVGSRRMAEGGHGILPRLHPRAAVDHRQHRRGQGGAPRRRHHPRRRGSLFRGRGRQGHRVLLRRCQRDRGLPALLAGRCLRLGRQPGL